MSQLLLDVHEHAVKFVQRVVADHQFALAFGTVLDLHFGADALGQILLQALDVRIAAHRPRFAPRVQPLAHQRFGLTNGQAAGNHLAGGLALLFGGQAEQGTGMAISISPRSSMTLTSSASDISRNRLVMVTRDLPTASATCCWVSSNSCCRRCSARASSMGLRSSRWIFSISAMAIAASSGTSRITAGMRSSPACWEARQRRSPAMIS